MDNIAPGQLDLFVKALRFLDFEWDFKKLLTLENIREVY